MLLAKWIRRLTNWNGRQVPLAVWEEKIVPLVKERLAQQKTPVVTLQNQAQRILALVSIADLHHARAGGPARRRPLEARRARGPARRLRPVLARPRLPRNCPPAPASPCSGGGSGWWTPPACPPCAAGSSASSARATAWPSPPRWRTRSYPLDELIYDLANLDAGFRFAGEDINRWGGRLGIVCHEKYGLQSIPGYLENGVPPKYGAGAEQIVASVHKNPLAKQVWITDLLGTGDIDRVIIEWRSLLRQIAHAPDLDWPRWRALQAMAKTILNETESPTLTDLPPLEYHQTRRVDHRLILRRH